VRRSSFTAQAVVISATLAAACAGDIRPDRPDGAPGPDSKVQVIDNGDGTTTVTVDATDLDSWVYIDLGRVELVEPADPASSSEWDLALQRFHYALNGGASGSGMGELAVVDGALLDDVGGEPEDGWFTDEPDDPEDEDDLPEFAFETAEGGWYDYNDITHVLTPKSRVYVVRGGTGEPFALRIEAYYSAADAAAWPKFTVKPLAR
jgi:hypothetical protein